MWKPEIRNRYLIENSKSAQLRIEKLKKWYNSENNKKYHREKVIDGIKKMPPENKIEYIKRITELRKKSKGTKLSVERKLNLHINNLGSKNPFYGRNHTEETKLKLRKIRLKQLEKFGMLNFIKPQYNIIACEYFDWLNNWNGWSGIHAKNGGEFYIEKLGYFTDYYEPNFNIVVEWDEERHYDVYGNLKEKDIIRQKRIIQELKCKFFRIRQSDFKIQQITE